MGGGLVTYWLENMAYIVQWPFFLQKILNCTKASVKSIKHTNSCIDDNYYGLTVASTYVGIAPKQDGSSNQCISIFTAISSPGNKC